jgi:hypothetical protein
VASGRSRRRSSRHATESHAEEELAYSESARLLETIASKYRAPIMLAPDTSYLAAQFILTSGREILPIGGYAGGIPSPTLAQLQRYIFSGQLRALLILRSSKDPRIVWIYRHGTRTSATQGESCCTSAARASASARRDGSKGTNPRAP